VKGDGVTSDITHDTFTATKNDSFSLKWSVSDWDASSDINAVTFASLDSATNTFLYLGHSSQDRLRFVWNSQTNDFALGASVVGREVDVTISYTGETTSSNNLIATVYNRLTGVTHTESKTVNTSSYADLRLNTVLSGAYKKSDSKMWSLEYTKNNTVVLCLPFQRSIYDISGNDNHGTSKNITWSTQDSYHYNVINGFDLYTDDATGLVEIYVPYVSGVPIVASIASYTKQSSHPAGTYHNGAETKWILGATTYDAGDEAWDVSAEVQAADVDHILHSASTSYGIPQSYDDMVAEQGNYLFIDVSTENQYKNVLLYKDKQIGSASVAIHNYIGNGSLLITDSEGAYVFENAYPNNYVLWEG